MVRFAKGGKRWGEGMRVSDCLQERDHEMEAGGNRNKRGGGLVLSLPRDPSASDSDSFTPRALLRNLVRFPKYCIKRERKKKKKGKEEEEKEEEREGMGGVEALAADERERASSREEEGKVDFGESNAEVSGTSGWKPESTSFNLGMGVGLVFLLVKSATEFSRMTELRRQMEILLKDIKDEIQRKNDTSGFSVSNNHTVRTTSNCWGDDSSSITTQNERASCHLVGVHKEIEFDRQSRCERTLQKRSGIRMNLLEEELEVELERLQTNLEGEDSSNLPPEHMELRSENDGHSESFSASSEEVRDELKEEDSREHCGVCPRELERRLHELLESRQQERIAELESALECAERTLHEKEREICWWRDTARLVSKHKDETLFR